LLALAADVTDVDSLAAPYRLLCAQWGMPDSVVINAGDYGPMDL